MALPKEYRIRKVPLQDQDDVAHDAVVLCLESGRSLDYLPKAKVFARGNYWQKQRVRAKYTPQVDTLDDYGFPNSLQDDRATCEQPPRAEANQALARMAPERREVAWRHGALGEQLKEIAPSLGLSVNGAFSRWWKAKKEAGAEVGKGYNW